MNLETRVAAEVRADGRRLVGYAARFGVEARVGTFVEVIQRGAFTGSLASGRDILALWDHSPQQVLARTRTGTLELREDAEGLTFTIQLPDTSAGRDVLALAERGDLGGMSFGFLVSEGGERWDGNRRELRAVDLMEVSVVSAWPAYDGTTVQARHRLPPRLAALRRELEILRWG